MKKIALWLAVLLMAGALWAEPVRIGPAVDATGAPVESKDVEVWVAMPGEDFRLEDVKIRYDRFGWYVVEMKRERPREGEATVVLNVPGSVIFPMAKYGRPTVNADMVKGTKPPNVDDLARRVAARLEPVGVIPFIMTRWYAHALMAVVIFAFAARVMVRWRRGRAEDRWLREQRDLLLIQEAHDGTA